MSKVVTYQIESNAPPVQKAVCQVFGKLYSSICGAENCERSHLNGVVRRHGKKTLDCEYVRVIHAHWLYKPYRGGWHCSNCDNLRDEYDDVEYPPEEKYCCECGAKMDEPPAW